MPGSPLLFYGVAYAFMNLGAFAVIAALQKRTGVTSSLGTFAGLGRREPMLGVLMTLFLLSLIGIPPTAGFFAKANIILAAVEAGGPLTILAVITVLNAAVAAFYYLRVVIYMFMRDSASDAPALRHGGLLWAGLAAATAFTILLGLFPTALLQAADTAARAITQVPGLGLDLAAVHRLRHRVGLVVGGGLLRERLGDELELGLRARPPRTSGARAARPWPRRAWSNGLVVRHMPQDLGDDVQEALVVVGPDLDDHAHHLLAVRHLGAVRRGRNIPVRAWRVDVDRLAFARLAEPGSS